MRPLTRSVRLFHQFHQFSCSSLIRTVIPSVRYCGSMSEAVEQKEAEERLPHDRIKKAKFAFAFSYCGAGYNGLQRNKGFQTIEEEVLKALRTTDMITENEFEKPCLLFFQRAARTDKGVSAAIQILSIRLPAHINDEVDRVNAALPAEIQMLGAIKVTKFFDSKNFCDGRTYSYLMPTFALAAPSALTCQSFRADDKLIHEFNQVLGLYKGTHNFHNFTSAKEATDPSAMRFIVSIDASPPYEKDGLQVTVVRIRGQSFMMHQIRKMIGMAIAVMRGFATTDRLKQAFRIEKIDVPRAPGLGLMLEDIHYDKYNTKFGGDGIHEPLSWSRWSEQIAKFKEKVIYPVMIRTEKEEDSMLRWLETLPLHTYETHDHDVPRSQKERTDFARAYFNTGKAVAAVEKETANDGDEANEQEEAEAEDGSLANEAPAVKKARTS